MYVIGEEECRMRGKKAKSKVIYVAVLEVSNLSLFGPDFLQKQDAHSDRSHLSAP